MALDGKPEDLGPRKRYRKTTYQFTVSVAELAQACGKPWAEITEQDLYDLTKRHPEWLVSEREFLADLN